MDPVANSAESSAHARRSTFGNLSEAFDLQRLLAIIRRRLPLAAAVGAAVFVLIAVFTFMQPHKYTAVSNVLLDQRQNDVLKVSEVQSALPKESNVVDTEVQVIRSRALADKVATALRLDQDPEFNPLLHKKGKLFGLLKPSSAPLTAADIIRNRQDIVNALLGGLKVDRAGLTYMINISYEASTPQKAAAIANKFAETYISEQLDAKYEATRQANNWLGSRLNELRGQVQTAEAGVEQYRIANNLLSAQGATLTEQQISRLDEQLALAKADEAERDARLSTARSQMAGGSTGDDVGEALNSQVIQNLRKQRAEVSAKVADMSQLYGDRYPPLLQAKSQLTEIDTQINEEIKRVVSNLEAQAQVSRMRAGSISGSINSSRGVLAGNNRATVKLRELERNAEAVRTLYETFLNRYRETSAQVGLADSDARIVSAAKPPTAPSSPNIPMGLILGMLIAGGCSMAAITLSEALDTSLSAGAQVEERLDLVCLGAIPLLSSIEEAKASKLPPEKFIVDKPFSSLSESLRNLLTVAVASRPDMPSKVLAITSSLPGEGKSMTSMGLARVAAVAGQKVILVDCDFRHRSATRLLDVAPTTGLAEVLNGDATFEQAVIRDDLTDLDVLPVSTGPTTRRSVFATDAMTELMAKLSEKYDLVVLDTPPVLPIADTLAIAPHAHMVICLIRWRKTPFKAVEATLRLLDQVSAPVVGAALTFVDMRQQTRHGYGDASYYYDAYKSYYLDDNAEPAPFAQGA